MKFTLIFILLLVGSAVNLNAQNDCAKLIKGTKKAEKLYDEGNLRESALLLDTLLTNVQYSTCSEEYLKAQILLTKANLFMNQDSLADISYRKVLKEDPMYQLDTGITAIEPIDLYYFSNQYQTVARWSLAVGVVSGRFNFPFSNSKNNKTISRINNFINIDNSPSFYNTTVTAEKSESLSRPRYKTGTGIGLEARLSFHPTNWLELGVGAQFERRSFEIEYPLTYSYYNFQSFFPATSSPNLSGPEEQQDLIQIKENQNWLNVPVTVRFNFSVKNFTPVLYFGGEFSYLQNSTIPIGEIQRGGVKNDGEINLKDLRNRVQYGLLGGIGFKYRISKITQHYIYFNLQYSRNIESINKVEAWFDDEYYNKDNKWADSEKREVIDELLYKFGYMDSDIRLGYLQASLGFVFTKYKAKKKKVKAF
jgi:hypothetical protein